MKRKSWLEKIKYDRREDPETEQMFFFAALFFAAAFLGILVVSSAEMATFDISRPQVAEPAAPKSSFERVLEKMVSGHPMEDMVPFIARQDPTTATFLVSIAKQESNWGKRSPKDAEGRECWNFWGYRGQTEKVTASGYSCFENPRQAVRVVGRRLNTLIDEYDLDTPRELIVWKCGSSCESHDPADVARWQRTVGLYSRKIEKEMTPDVL